MAKKIVIELDDNTYQELFQEWKEIKESKLFNSVDCTTFESFATSILKSFVTTNKLTENFKDGNLAILLENLKDLIPNGDLSSLMDFFNYNSKKNNETEKKAKDNGKYKS